MTLRPMEQYQLAMAHVLAHPHLEDAVREAWSAGEGVAAAGEIDLAPYLERHGFSLPQGATARLGGRDAATESEPAAWLIVCVQIDDRSWCVTIQPPITVESL